MKPLCDYSIDREPNGYRYNGNGQVYFVVVHTLEEMPSNSEMGRIGLLDSLPDELTDSNIFFLLALTNLCNQT